MALQVIDKTKMDNKVECDLILASLKPYEFVNYEGEASCDIASFLYDEKDWQGELEKHGFDHAVIKDFLKWCPNREEWLIKIGISKDIIAIAKDQMEAIIPGEKPAMFSHLDFARDKAWERFKHGDPYIRKDDFINPEKFKKYFIISMGLTEGNVIVHGKEGGGKSLWSYHIAYQINSLFGKKCTLKPKPKKPVWEFTDSMTSLQLVEEIDGLKELTGKANDLTEEDQDSSEMQEMLAKSKLYRRIIVDDESYQDLEPKRQTNTTIAWGRLVRQHAHLHSLFIFIAPDKRDIAGRLIYNRRTHEVSCSKYGGICHYVIFWQNEQVQRSMTLDPRDWLWLWRRDNLVGDGGKLKMRGL